MKYRRLAFAAAMLLLLATPLSGCSSAPEPAPELPAEPTAAPEPEGSSGQAAPPETAADGYGLSSKTILFPEGGSEENASYILTYTLPHFTDGSLQAENMNASVGLFEEELLERAQEEYLPVAMESEDTGRTEVSVQTLEARGYTSLLLTERSVFGDTETETFSTLVFNGAGTECALADAALAGVGELEALTAQLVYNRMDQERDKYFTDLSPADIAGFMDLYNGYYVTETGYTLYFAAGTIAPDTEGAILMELSDEDFYPAFVGDLLSAEAYVAVSPLLDSIGCHAAEGFESFSGAPSPYVATAVMYETIVSMPEPLEEPFSVDADGAVSVAYGDFETLYGEYFSGSFPGCYGLDELMYVQDGVVHIKPWNAPLPSANTRVFLTDAEEGGEEGLLLLTGTLTVNAPGAPEPTAVSGVRVELQLDDEAPARCRILSFEFTR